MSASSRWVRFVRFALLALLVGWTACTGPTYIGGRCGETEDCHTPANNIPGTICTDSVCECLSGEDKCCPEGDNAKCEEVGDYRCRPYYECHPPEPECDSADDCPGPPLPQCGSAMCEKGKCSFDLKHPNMPLASQKPGDCRTSYCDREGKETIQNDTSDMPIDAEPCTVDLCKDGLSAPLFIPDGTPCPEIDSGVCFKGACVGCIDNGDCKNPNAPKCDGSTCVPWSCVDGLLNGTESDYDCGGTGCKPCDPGQTCKSHSDCRSSHCLAGKCQSATHTDKIKNGGETGVDCGCAECSVKCKDGEGCDHSLDCLSAVCYGAICQKPTCTDGTQNGAELGPDCGGPCALPCPG